MSAVVTSTFLGFTGQFTYLDLDYHSDCNEAHNKRDRGQKQF